MSTEVIDAVLDGDAAAFKAAVDASLANKVSDAIAGRKVELASSLITDPTDNTDDAEEEIVDGTESSTSDSDPATTDSE